MALQLTIPGAVRTITLMDAGSVDQKVLDLAPERPADAVKLLRDEYGDALRAYLSAWLPRSAVDDAFQQTWLHVMEILRKFKQLDEQQKPVHARAWVFGIARHKGADFLRGRKRHEPAAHLESIVSRLAQSSARSPSKQVLSAEQAWILRGLVAELDGCERKLLEWRYREGCMPAAWIERIEKEGCAAELGVEPAMAEYLAAQGDERARLRKRLKDQLMQRLSRVVRRFAEVWGEEEEGVRVA